jgi:hypothetical protein
MSGSYMPNDSVFNLNPEKKGSRITFFGLLLCFVAASNSGDYSASVATANHRLRQLVPCSRPTAQSRPVNFYWTSPVQSSLIPSLDEVHDVICVRSKTVYVFRNEVFH